MPYDRIIATVKMRRGDGWHVKPCAEQIEGRRHRFLYGWKMDEGDTSLYAGEIAWIADHADWPSDAPAWVASGDLADIVEEKV